jgi:hypothetical protein
LYFETLSRKDFLRDKAGEASRDCDGDERERKEGCAKEIAGSEFRIVFLCDGTDKSPVSREVRGRQKMAIIKDTMGLMAAIARLRLRAHQEERFVGEAGVLRTKALGVVLFLDVNQFFRSGDGGDRYVVVASFL